MKLKPWYDVVKPREDLREGKPLDASEFAVHLDKVRLGNAPDDYKIPQRFFDRTYLTENLAALGAEVVRRLSGITTETSAVFNMTTQFGGGKTHALTLLYHLAKNGHAANGWRGVAKILKQAGVKSVPDKCAIGIFVGTEFDSVTGRGGSDGTPLRKTPWGEIAYQLGGEAGFAHVANSASVAISRRSAPPTNRCVFIIHGHDELNRLRLQNMLKERLDLEPIVISSKPGQSQSIIDKFEEHAKRCTFAIALFTPDDLVTQDNEKYYQAWRATIILTGQRQLS